MEEENREDDEIEREDSPDQTEERKEIEEKREVRIDNNPDDKFKMVKKNPWVTTSVVLGAVTLVLLILMFRGGITGGVVGVGTVISEQEAGEKILEFASGQGVDLEIVEVNDNGNFYEVVADINGQEAPLYVTKDGEYFVQNLIPLDLAMQPNTPSQQQQPQPSVSYSEEDLVKIKEFSQCLADNGVKAYGAGWCGYCKKLKDAFGGEEQINPFYFECQNADRTPTEYADLCEQEKITGFPTIKINGEPYRGDRTIE